MIINLRGTNGSGKSTIVHRLLKENEHQSVPYHDRSKRKPMGYVCTGLVPQLFVAGHYEIANGGMDTLPDTEYAYRIIEKYHREGMNVLYEGKNFNEGILQIMYWHQRKLDIRVIFLNHPLEDCISSVRQRGHVIKTGTIKRLFFKSVRESDNLTGSGICCLELSRENAWIKVNEWLQTGASNVREQRQERLSSSAANDGLPAEAGQD